MTITGLTLSILKPDGTTLVAPTSFNTNGGAIETHVLSTSGTYTILIDPSLVYTGNVTLTLYNTPDVSGSITIDGATVTTTLTVPGQRARYTFTGTAGQWVNLGLTAVTISSSTVSMLKPDGTTLVSTTVTTSEGSLDPTTSLPTTGTYTIVVDPAGLSIGNMTLTLTSPLTGTIALDGASVPISLTKAGQTARYTFSGTAGQWVYLGLTAVTITTSAISLVKPDGTTLASTTIGTGGRSLDPTTALPTTGTYTIVVDPIGLSSGSMTLTLTLTSPLTGTITLDGASVPISLTKADQTARYTFSGTSGQWLSLGLTGVTIASSTVTLLKPDGTTLASTTVGTSGGGLEPPSTLPTTGTYTIVVDPTGVSTGTITLTLMSYLSGTLNLNGAATTTTMTPIGRNARYTFTGTAGQWVSLGMTSVTITSATVTLWKPDGTTLTSTSVGAGGGSLDAPIAMPTTGTYTVTVNPAAQYTGTITLTLSTDVTGSVTINAAATPVTINRAGQNARYTFAGTASQQATVKITGNTLGSTTVNLYTPSGAWQTGTTNSAANFNLSTVTLATTGTYTITLNPTTTATGTLNLQVTSP